MSKANVPSVSTANELRRRKNGLSWREVAASLNYGPSSGATLSAVAERKPGAISRRGEAELRVRLGLAVRHRAHYHRPCMTADVYARWLEFKAALDAAREAE